LRCRGDDPGIVTRGSTDAVMVRIVSCEPSRHFFWLDPGGVAVAKREDLKPAMQTCIRFDAALAEKIKEGAEQNERGWNQEVRFQLRRAYGLDRTPAEDAAGVSA
jgi:hypothetical protein